MIEVSLRLIATSDQREEFLKAILPILGPTRVSSGCKRCMLVEDIEDPDTLFLLEEWETEADLTSHVRSKNYQRLLQIMEMSVEQPEIRLNKISQTWGMEVLEEMRR